MVGGMFLNGFGYGLTGRSIIDMKSSLEAIEKPFRGFSYEGCSMALAVRDALLPARRHWVNDFLAGPASHRLHGSHRSWLGDGAAPLSSLAGDHARGRSAALAGP